MLKNSELLPKPSEEQEDIISAFKDGFNIKIEAVAGAGKSTTLLFLAKTAAESFGEKVLLITYSKDLKNEIKKRINFCDLSSILDVYTYHGYASKLYGRTINDDKKFFDAIESCLLLKKNYNIVLLDEVQDMNEHYNIFVNKFIKDEGILVIVGDSRQCIKEHIGADKKYLIENLKYFPTKRPWKDLKLRTSYRLTAYNANFVNKYILNQEKILPGNRKNNNLKPIYHNGMWDVTNLVTKMVKKYGPDQVKILVPSVAAANNPSTPLGKLFKNRSTDILYCVNDGYTDQSTMKGKVTITTYDSMKGSESDCVILFGFDESYFQFYNKKWPSSEIRNSLPDILYVASTRAREQLVIIKDSKRAHLRTINELELHNDVIMKGDYSTETFYPAREEQITKRVTQAIKHLSFKVMSKLKSLIKVEVEVPASDILQYQHIANFEGYSEDMKSYYGTIIPWLVEKEIKSSIDPRLSNSGKKSLASWSDVDKRYKKLLKTVNCNNTEKYLKELAELAVLWTSAENGMRFLSDQITNYNWLDENFVIECKNRLYSVLPKNGSFEVVFSQKNKKEKPGSSILIEGQIDYLTEEESWELKCVQSLTDEHIMQCATYICLRHIYGGELLRCKLFNVRTMEILIISVEDPDLFHHILISNNN